MKKKIAIIALCIGLLTGAVVNAQEVRVEQKSQTVVISDNIAPNTLGILFVVKSGESINDNKMIYALRNAFSDNDGRIEFTFDMPEKRDEVLTDGVYDLYIKENGNAVKTGRMFYATLETRTNLLGQIKSVKSDTELKTILENEDNKIALEAIGCRSDLYKASAASLMYNYINDIAAVGQDDLKNAYNAAVVTAGMSLADTKEAAELLNVANPSFEKVGYNDISDKRLTDWINSELAGKSFDSVEKMFNAYETANVLYKINNAVAEDIEEFLKNYADVLGIEKQTEYTNYKNTSNKVKLNIKIAELLAANPAKTSEELLTAVKNAVNSLPQPGKGNGGGGGGSSAPSKNNGYVSGVPVEENKPKDEIVFNDMASAKWAEEAVKALADANVVAGDEKGSFRPNDYITREEFVKMLVLASGRYNENAKCNFDDVLQNAWYYSYVASAFEAGIASGVSETSFGIGEYLTRQDMTVLCARTKRQFEVIREDDTFADNNEIADYAKEAVSKLYKAGVVSGMGNNNFVPLGNATRAQCAQMIYNLFFK